MKPQIPDDPISRIQQKRQAQAGFDVDQSRTDSIIDAVKSSGGETKDGITSAMHDILMATLIGKDPKIAEVAKNLAGLLESIDKASKNVKSSSLEVLPSVYKSLVDAIAELPGKLAESDNTEVLIPYLEGINKTIQGKNTNPVVTVNNKDVKLDAKEVVDAIKDLKKVLQNVTKPEKEGKEADLTPLVDAVNKVTFAVNHQQFPVSNYVLPFRDDSGAATQITAVTSSTDPTKTGLIALNPDGSNISGGGGGGGTQYAEGVTTSPATGTVSLGRYSTSAPVLTNGQLNAPQLDVNGNTKIVPASATLPVQLNASQTTTTGSITTSTTTITVTDLAGVGAVTVTIFGTYAGVNVTFEQSLDGSTWANATAVPTTLVNPTAISGATGVLTTNSTNIWNVSPLLGVAQFRVRATAFGSGSASVRIEPSAQFVQPNVLVTNPTAANLNATVTGTVTANIGTGGTGATSLGKAEDAVHASGDTGVAVWGVVNTGAATSFAANGDYSPHAVDVQGRRYVTMKAPAATLSNVSGSASSVTVLAANTGRLGATVTNDSSALLYLKLGATASTTSYTVVLAGNASAPFAYYELPFGYTGIIDGIWSSATGTARVTELS